MTASSAPAADLIESRYWPPPTTTSMQTPRRIVLREGQGHHPVLSKQRHCILLSRIEARRVQESGGDSALLASHLRSVVCGWLQER